MLHILAICCYIIHFVAQIRARHDYPRWLVLPLSAGLVLQFIVLVQPFITFGAFGFFQVISLAGFGCVLTVTILHIFGTNCSFLHLWVVPIVCLSILADLLFDNTYLPAYINTIGLVLHVLLSMTALSLVSVSSILLLCSMIRDHQLKKPDGKQWRFIPAIETLKKLSNSLLLIAWIALSLSVVSGLVFVEDFLAQKLTHKTFFMVLAWLLLSFMLFWIRKHSLTWKKCFILCIMVNLSMLLGYFGSRFVLEFILS